MSELRPMPENGLRVAHALRRTSKALDEAKLKHAEALAEFCNTFEPEISASLKAAARYFQDHPNDHRPL